MFMPSDKLMRGACGPLATGAPTFLQSGHHGNGCAAQGSEASRSDVKEYLQGTCISVQLWRVTPRSDQVALQGGPSDEANGSRG